jgi:hypothetical protein
MHPNAYPVGSQTQTILLQTLAACAFIPSKTDTVPHAPGKNPSSGNIEMPPPVAA